MWLFHNAGSNYWSVGAEQFINGVGYGSKIRVEIGDDEVAMLFKLTFSGVYEEYKSPDLRILEQIAADWGLK